MTNERTNLAGPYRVVNHDLLQKRLLRTNIRGMGSMSRSARTALMRPTLLAVGDTIVPRPAYKKGPTSVREEILYWRRNGVPRELEEQGLIDGLSRMGALLRIVLPLSAPGIAAVSIFVFTGAWNELLFALVLVTSESQRTAPLALNYLITSDVLPRGPLMAGAVISSVPLMILYFVAQRFMVQGLAAGSVKG